MLSKKEKPKSVFPMNSLSCAQTPLQFPRDRSTNDLPLYKTASIRLLGETPGPGRVLKREAKDGQLIEENSQITLIFERNNYNISDTILHIPGMHRAPGEEKIADGEIHMYFRNTKSNPTKSDIRDDICLIVPIRTGQSGKGIEYFEYLNREATLRTQNLPAFTKNLIDKTPAILYKGKDLKNRGCGMPEPEYQCSPDSYTVQYIYLTKPIFARVKDLERLRTTNPTVELEPPADPISPTDLRKFCAYYQDPGVRIGSSQQAPHDLPAGIKKMNQLKCRPIDTKRDIKGDNIVVDPKARFVSLPDELRSPKELRDDDEINEVKVSQSDWQPGDFEDVLAIPVAIFIGYVVAGGVLGMVRYAIFK